MPHINQIGFLLVTGINEWNELPQEVVDASSINTFKNRLDRHTGMIWAFSADWLYSPSTSNTSKYVSHSLTQSIDDARHYGNVSRQTVNLRRDVPSTRPASS